MRKVYNQIINDNGLVNWNYIKSRNNLYRHYIENEEKYIIQAHEDTAIYKCEIKKTVPKSVEQIEFEEYYKLIWCEIGFLNYGDWFNDLTLNINNRTNTGNLAADANGWYCIYWDFTLPFDAFIAGGHLQVDENAILGEALSLAIVVPVPPEGYEYAYVNRRRIRPNEVYDLKMQWNEMKFLTAGMILRFRYYTKRIDSNINLTLDYYFRKY